MLGELIDKTSIGEDESTANCSLKLISSMVSGNRAHVDLHSEGALVVFEL